MEDKEVIDGNLLIAEFMGTKIGIGVTEPIREEHLAYHKEWGWLMPVVEKIEQLPNIDTDIFPYYDKDKKVYTFEIGEDSHNKGYGESSSKIEAVWLAVVDFIKFYNTNK